MIFQLILNLTSGNGVGRKWVNWLQLQGADQLKFKCLKKYSEASKSKYVKIKENCLEIFWKPDWKKFLEEVENKA